ncbi:TonB-dependent receptor plug domain-containing protein [Spirosoma soli]|uniref:TonB-dependent receptor plug domain-containing protein n=1 Tax=Spirosoma soli TaxID=1770529 RepID=A0ABW5M466_9BACT
MTFAFAILFAAYQLPDSTAPDSVKGRALEEVVVTATRSERPMGALPLPVAVVSQKQIRQMGSLRLNDVLREQTGLAIVTDHGQGLQVQGFGPDYTLILIDGEPIVGRTAGTLDLTRLAVGNIKQVEIVKGPSSSLYGSEALAGVVNIITETPGQAKGSLSARYGANQTSDLSADVSYKWPVGKAGKLGLYAFGDRYQSAGYSLTPEAGSQTVAPFVNYTANGRISWEFSPALKLSISGRYFTERQANAFAVNTAEHVSGPGTVRNYTLNPVVTHQLSTAWKLTYRYYRTGYQTSTDLHYNDTQAAYDASFFRQTFNRPEIMVEHVINNKHILTLGAGLIAESVEATRYTSRKQFQTRYGFLQYEWMPTARLTIIAGGRYDVHSQYASQFSPKASARYDLNSLIALRGSVGAGFKAPDFRQLYLNFDNAVAGYSVFGTQELADGIDRLQRQGQIAEVLLNPAQFRAIRAESSVAYNLGVQLKAPKQPFTANINLFRNDIRDLIETQVVARKTNGQNVFSYTNLNQVFTQGAEVDGSYQWSLGSGQLMLSGGYQYLVAKDKAVLAGVKAGTVYRRNPETLVSERVSSSEYGGLLNRSRHMANVKLFYEHAKNGVSASLRSIYRGRYGFADRDGNLILDNDSEYVRGYVTHNVSAAKTWAIRDVGSLALQVGVDNLAGYTDPQYIPNLAGRLWYASLRWNWMPRLKRAS